MSKHSDTKDNSIAKLLKYGIYAIAFIPLVIFSEFLSPFHFGKVVVLRALVEIMVVLYFVLIISRGGRKYLPPKSKILWAFIAFAIVFGITGYTGIDPYQSFWGTLERMGGWFTFIHYLAFFIIAISMFRKKEEWIRLIQFSLFASLLSAGYGFLQKTDVSWIIGAGGRPKIFGTMGNPALFAGYIIINAFLALMMFFRDDATPEGKRFYFSVFLIDALAVMLTGVRGSVVGLVIGLLIFGFMHKSREIKKYTAAFLTLVIISAAVLSLLHDTEFVKRNAYLDRYSDFSPTTFTVQTRVWAWKAGIDGWNDSLKTMIVGYGPENFNYPFSFHFNPKFYGGPGSETLFDRAHNMFVEVLVTMGIVGLISYVLLFAAAFAAIRRLGSENWVYKAGLTALLVAYMIHNSFIFDTSANFIAFFIVLGFILFLDPATKRREIIQEEPVTMGTGLTFLMIILFLVTAVVIYKTDIRPAKANYATTRAIVAAWNNNLDKCLGKYEEALSYDDVPIKYEIRHRFAKFIIDYSNSKNALSNPKIVDTLNLAIQEVEKNKEERPHDYLPYLHLARLHIMLGKDDPKSSHNDIAIEETEKALEISPTFIRSYFEIAQAYLNKKDHANAIKYFQRAQELQPDAKVIQWYLGMAYIDAGQIQKGLQYLGESGNLSEPQLLRMVDVFVSLGNFRKVAELYEQLVTLQPQNAQYHASLAVAYAKIGRINDAIAEAQIAAQIDPSFGPEAQAFINSLIGN